MITEHHSIVRSKRVLAALKKLMRGSKIELYLTHWANGREQGYHLSWRLTKDRLWVTAKCHELSFAEDRRSDQVVIVHGPEEMFEPINHTPLEELWKKPNLIYVDEPEAALMIWDIIQKTTHAAKIEAVLAKEVKVEAT